MREIPLTKGLVTVVDDADYDVVVAVGSWCAKLAPRTAYAVRGHLYPRGVRGLLALHTFLTGWSLVDHRDGDGLNNRRSNLRNATKAQNSQNAGPAIHNTSGYRGVSRDHDRDPGWHAYITVDRRRISLGRFSTAEEAAVAYDVMAVRHFGEFAHPNFPDRSTV